MKMILSFLLAINSSILFAQTPEPPPPPSPADTTGGGVFEKVDVEARFTGGNAEWMKYLMKNLDANVPVENSAPIGIYTVIVQFIVDKTGAISDMKTLTNFGYGMENEVLRIIKMSPPWIPAKQNNRTVKAYRKQPITFVVEDEEVEIIMDDKYNLYTGEDNKIRINVEKVKKDDLEVSISQGTVTPGDDGNFHINVKAPGKAILYIKHKNRKKELGSVYFIVKKKS